MDAWWEWLFFVIGVLAVLYILLCLFKILYNIVFPYFLACPKNLHNLAGAKWAVVTGATDGIGKAYAQQLARKGFNILLVSRTQTKLDDVKAEILRESKEIEVDTFAFDFTVGSRAAYEPLLSAINKIEVGILVNNVGMAFDYPELLHLIDGGLQKIADTTIINTLPTALLCADVIKQMITRQKGVIINVASSSGLAEMPYWSVYSSAKRFVMHLSSILRKEYASTGITIQCICPFQVSTKAAMDDLTSPFSIPNAETFVASALRTVGYVDQTTGYWNHQIQGELMGLLPDCLATRIVISASKKARDSAVKKRATIT